MRLLVISLVCLLPLCAQNQSNDQGKKTRELPAPTNLKVLKVTTGPEVFRVMQTFTTGLGVRCSYCHVQRDFASDANPKKETARRMISMANRINAGFPDGKTHVTCYTCHRGEIEPKIAPEPKTAQ